MTGTVADMLRPFFEGAIAVSGTPWTILGTQAAQQRFFRFSLLSKFRYVCDRVFTPGRCQVIEVEGSRGNLQMFGIHFYPVRDDARHVRTLLHLRSELKPTS